MMPATLSIITNAFPPHERGKAIGTWAGVSAIALAIGPVVGGFLVENVSWQSIFLINVPVAVIAVGVTLWATHESRDEIRPARRRLPRRRDDRRRPGRVRARARRGQLLGLGLGSHPRPVRRLRPSASSPSCAPSAAAPAPMVDFTFFRSRSFLGSNIVAFIVSFAMLAMFFFLALYMQNIRGYTAAARPACASCPRPS